MLTLGIFVKWVNMLAVVYDANKNYLTELDSAIGDADHGINLARGFGAVKEAVAKAPPADIPALFKTVSMTLIKTVGGASGPLYGTLFMKSGPLLKESPVTPAALAAAFEAGVAGIKAMGKSTTGEKTMLDAWVPALEVMKAEAAAGSNANLALIKAASAAKEGMEKTIPMLATKGRASYLGERSVGHQDPGATSTMLMLKTLAEAAG